MAKRPPQDWSYFGDIIELVLRLEAKLVRLGVHDNQRCQALWLQLHPDGSGAVMCEYSKASHDETPERRLVRTVFSETQPIIEFDSLEQLHGDLVAQTMRVKRGK